MLPSQIFARLDQYDDIDQHFQWTEDMLDGYTEAEEEFGDSSTVVDYL